MHELEGRLRQENVEVMDLQRQVQAMAAQLRKAMSTSRGSHQRLQVNVIEHKNRMHEVFERAATLWQNQVI